MQHYAAFHLSLHCLQKYSFRGYKGLTLTFYNAGYLHIPYSSAISNQKQDSKKPADVDSHVFQNKIYSKTCVKRPFAKKTDYRLKLHNL